MIAAATWYSICFPKSCQLFCEWQIFFFPKVVIPVVAITPVTDCIQFVTRPYHGHLDHEHSYLIFIMYYIFWKKHSPELTKEVRLFASTYIYCLQIRGWRPEICKSFSRSLKNFFFQTESSASAAIDDVGSKTKLDFLGKLFVYYTYVHFHSFTFARQG